MIRGLYRNSAPQGQSCGILFGKMEEQGGSGILLEGKEGKEEKGRGGINWVWFDSWIISNIVVAIY